MYLIKKKKILVFFILLYFRLGMTKKSITVNINVGLDSASISLTFVTKIDVFEL